jgi:formylmethanofuran dehydrogenase subunit E
MSYYDGDSWSNHKLNEIKCAECGEEFDQQEEEGEGNICPACKEKEGESK